MGRAKALSEEQVDDMVTRFRDGSASLGMLMSQYRIGYQTITDLLFGRMDYTEYAACISLRRRTRPKKGCFVTGSVPWNKGRAYHAGGRSIETQWKPGEIRGQAARLYRAVGSVVVRFAKPPKRYRGRANARKGPPSRWIKVRDDGPPAGRFVPYARYLWEQRHGPVPPGRLVVHADGDTMNDEPDNLILITQAENMQRLLARAEIMEVCYERLGKATRARHEGNRRIKAERCRKELAAVGV